MAYTVTAYSGDKITVGSVNSRTEFTTNVDAGMRGDTGYSGSLGYSGSIGYTGSIGVGYTGSQGEVNTYTVVTQSVTVNRIFQPINTFINSYGPVTHNFELGDYLLFISPTGNITLNLTNVNLPIGQYTKVKASVVQSNTIAHMINSVLVDGAVPQLFWEGDGIPTGDIGKVNDIVFEIYRYSSINYVAKASTITYSEII